MLKKLFLFSILTGSLLLAGANEFKLLNVSYDPTREFYAAYNALFTKYWADTKKEDKITITQSHGGSGKQARSVIDGLEADVVTLALAYDIDAIADKSKLLPADWQKKYNDNSSPYTSTIVFLVRHGNPKKIKDWDDLIKPGISVITPNPKTSGGARWNYLAAWGFALKKYKDEKKVKEFIKSLYANVPVLDSGARGSTTTFAQRELGDVLITWENEAFLTQKEFGTTKFDIIPPSISILAEPPIAVVEKNAKNHGTTKIAGEYLKYLYSTEAQEVIAKNFYRPRNAAVLKKYEALFPKIALFTIDEVFGGWKKAQKTHFDDGGIFDELYEPSRL